MKKSLWVFILFAAVTLFGIILFRLGSAERASSGRASEALATHRIRTPANPALNPSTLDPVEFTASVENTRSSSIPEQALASSLSLLLDCSNLLTESTEPIGDRRLRRTQIWETDGTYPFIRTEEAVELDEQGSETVVSRVAMVADHLLVQLEEPKPDATTVARLSSLGADLFETVTGGGLYRARIQPFDDPERMPQVLASLQREGVGIRFCEPDYILETQRRIPNDPKFREQTWFDRTRVGSEPNHDMDAPEGWEIRSSAPDVVVAIVDTGIHLTHEDLQPNLWVNPGEIPANGLDDDGNGVIDDVHGFDAIKGSALEGDPEGHGTLVAGVIGAVGNNGKGIAGVAWKVKLMGARFLDQNGTGATSDAIKAIDYAVANGAGLINNSWGGAGHTYALEDALKRAGKAGVLSVTAAGNSHRSIGAIPTYPAAFDLPDQVVVAAVDDSDTLATFSNFSSSLVHLAAPESAFSTDYNSVSSYAIFHGTSAAAPYVTGTAALLFAHLPDATASSVTARILSTVEVRASLNPYVATGGRLNIHRALAGEVETPANDAFADATVMPSDGSFVSGVLIRSGKEPIEPTPPGFLGQTVWYRFTPDRDAFAEIRLRPLGFEAGIALYTGESIGSLQLVQSRRSTSFGQPLTLTETLKANQTYRIQVDRTAGVAGPFTLSVALAPGNDLLGNAIELSGDAFEIEGTTRLASAQPDEPTHHPQASRRSVWYRWTAPKSGTFALSGESVDGTVFPAVYEGDTMLDLGRSDSVFDRGIASQLLIPVLENHAYVIAVDSQNANGSSFSLWGRFITGPRLFAEPQDQSVLLGGDAVFSVTVNGGTDPQFQWYFNGKALVAETSSSLIVSGVTPEMTGIYHVVVATGGVILESRSARLSIGGSPPRILIPPRSTAVTVGSSVTLSVLTDPASGVDFQWIRDGEAIEGANGPSYNFLNAELEDSGFYGVSVSNQFGISHSSPVFLSVTSGSTDSHFSLPAVFGPPGQINMINWVHDRYFVTGFGGLIGFSLDGENWQYSSVPAIGDLYGWTVCFGNGIWVIGGTQGSARSANLIEWEKADDGVGGVLAVTFGAGRFVRSLFSGVSYSQDGRSWTPATGLPEDLIVGLAFDGQVFLASSPPGIYQSPDGMTWEKVNRTGATGYGRLQHSASRGWWIREQYGRMLRSSDGKHWTEVTPSPWRASDIKIDSIDGEVYLADDKGIAVWSGAKWTTLDESAQWASDFVVRGGSMTGISGRQVAPLTAPAPPYDNGALWSGHLVSANDRFFLFRDSEILESSDGLNWSGTANPESLLPDSRRFAYGNGVYAFSGGRGTHPAAFEKMDTFWEHVVFGDGFFLAVASSQVSRSIDGLEWAEVASPFPESVSALAFQNDVFVAAGREFIAYSIDGITWTVKQGVELQHVSFLAYGNGVHIALSTDGTIQTSADGRTWTTKGKASPSGVGASIQSLIFHQGRFLAIGDRSIIQSTNGVDWTLATDSLSAYEPWRLLAAGDAVLVISSYAPPALLGTPKTESAFLDFLHPSGRPVVLPNSPVAIELLASSPGDPFEQVIITVNGNEFATLIPPDLSVQFTPEAPGDYRIEAVGKTAGGLEVTRTRFLTAALGGSPGGPPSTLRLFDMTFFEGAFYGAGPDGIIYVSLDGQDWIAMQTPSSADVRHFQVAPAGICATDEAGGILFSPNGVKWVYFPDMRLYWLFERSRTDFFAIADWLSVDGLNWYNHKTGISRGPAGNPPDVPASLFGYLGSDRGRPGSRSTAVDVAASEEAGRILPWKGQTIKLNSTALFLSSDGFEWEEITPPGYPAGNVSQIDVTGDLLILRDYASYEDRPGAIHQSVDGINWQRIATDRGHLATVSWNGMLISATRGDVRISRDGLIWETVMELDPNVSGLSRMISGPLGVVFLRAPYELSHPTVIASTRDGRTWVHGSAEPLATVNRTTAMTQSPVIYSASSRSVLIEAADSNEDSPADLALVRATAPAVDKSVGDTIPIELLFRNAGRSGLPARDLQVDVLLTTRKGVWGVPEDGRHLLRSFRVSLPALSADSNHTAITNLQLPDTMRPGDYYLAARIRPSRSVIDANSENDVVLGDAVSVVRIPKRNLSIEIAGEGRVDSSLPLNDLANGQVVVLSPQPADGYEFTSWAGDVETGLDVATVRMDRDRSVTATFSRRRYSVTVATLGEGTVSGVPASGSALFGDEVNLQAESAVHWRFDAWTGDRQTSESTVHLAVARDQRLLARFVQDYVMWTATAMSGADEERKAPDFDADGDGYSNEAEFALGTDPLDATGMPTVRIRREAASLVIDLGVNPTAFGTSVGLESSFDLIDWVPVPDPVASDPLDSDPAIRTYRLSGTFTEAVFIRIASEKVSVFNIQPGSTEVPD
ncbi:MAG: S8 family serine peptidase [Opitutaceae bacterium]